MGNTWCSGVKNNYEHNVVVINSYELASVSTKCRRCYYSLVNELQNIHGCLFLERKIFMAAYFLSAGLKP